MGDDDKMNKYIIGVTGPRGRLGSVLVSMGCVPLEFDVRNKAQVAQVIREAAPNLIIHTAAFTSVDLAQDDPERAIAVNVRGTANVRDSFSGPIILTSTDFIFDGKSGPYRENDKVNPLNWYGQSKLAQENMMDLRCDVIIRTTNLYGNWNKSDFVQEILKRYEAQNTISFFVTDKLRGNPTYIPHLAEALLYISEKKMNGIGVPHILNVAGYPVMSRYQFAQLIGKVFCQDTSKCQPSLEGLPTDKAKRPKKAGFVLDRAKKLGVPLYSVENGLHAMLDMRP
jgi:dTDP-4-dehydrorhamnose reductase